MREYVYVIRVERQFDTLFYRGMDDYAKSTWTPLRENAWETSIEEVARAEVMKIALSGYPHQCRIVRRTGEAR